MIPTRTSTRLGLALPLAALAAALGCGNGFARTSLDEDRSVNPTVLRAVIASDGLSVGALRTAVLPGGATFVVVVPEPSDGYAPQVSVLRLDNGQPVVETESVCSPFDWASRVTGDLFMGMDPVNITAVERGDWDESGNQDLLVTIETVVEYSDGSGSSGRAELLARCAFRVVDDESYGRLAVSVLPLILKAESHTTGYGEDTLVREEQFVQPVEGQPGTIDLTVTDRTVTCGQFGAQDGRPECVPQVDSSTRRYRVQGVGIETTYQPIGSYYGGYNYGYLRGSGVGTIPTYDGTATGYDQTATGYDSTATGYDDTSTGDDSTATGDDDTSTGYDEESTGPDEDSPGDDEGGDGDEEPSSSCNGR